MNTFLSNATSQIPKSKSSIVTTIMPSFLEIINMMKIGRNKTHHVWFENKKNEMTKQDHNVEMKLPLKTKVKKFGNQQRKKFEEFI